MPLPDVRSPDAIFNRGSIASRIKPSVIPSTFHVFQPM